MIIDTVVTHPDWAAAWGNWGRVGVRRIADACAAGGIRRIYWRANCGSRVFYPSRLEDTFRGEDREACEVPGYWKITLAGNRLLDLESAARGRGVHPRSRPRALGLVQPLRRVPVDWISWLAAGLCREAHIMLPEWNLARLDPEEVKRQIRQARRSAGDGGGILAGIYCYNMDQLGLQEGSARLEAGVRAAREAGAHGVVLWESTSIESWSGLGQVPPVGTVGHRRAAGRGGLILRRRFRYHGGSRPQGPASIIIFFPFPSALGPGAMHRKKGVVMSKSSISRRRFLSRSAGVGAGLAVTGFPGIASARNVNNRINVGIVGPGGRGTSLLKNFFAQNHRFNAHLTAVADLWSYRREESSKFVTEKQGQVPKVYRHHEEILADADVDAVIIATPDHAHAQVLQAAAEAGKDAYCEKPMSNVLEEANDALDAVKKAGTIVQIGTQRRSWPKYRQAAKMIADGVIGDVVKVDILWNAYSPYRWAGRADQRAMVKESDVDWNSWLMGKPHRPFDPRIFRCFRLWKDFSSGIIDQWMTHGIDLAHMLAGVTTPLSAVAHGGIYQWKDWRENPDTMEVALEYEKDGNKLMAVYSTNLINGYGKATQVHGTLGSFSPRWRDGLENRARRSPTPIRPRVGDSRARASRPTGRWPTRSRCRTLPAKSATWPIGWTRSGSGIPRSSTARSTRATPTPSPASCPTMPTGLASA